MADGCGYRKWRRRWQRVEMSFFCCLCPFAPSLDLPIAIVKYISPRNAELHNQADGTCSASCAVSRSSASRCSSRIRRCRASTSRNSAAVLANCVSVSSSCTLVSCNGRKIRRNSESYAGSVHAAELVPSTPLTVARAKESKAMPVSFGGPLPLSL